MASFFSASRSTSPPIETTPRGPRIASCGAPRPFSPTHVNAGLDDRGRAAYKSNRRRPVTVRRKG
jgi:hypothetical protein